MGRYKWQIFGAGGEFFTFEKRKEGRTKKERRKGGKSERKFVYFSKIAKDTRSYIRKKVGN